MVENSSQDRPSIGFIGLGSMGTLMVQRLHQAGYQMTVYDRTREKGHEEDYSVMIQFMEQLSVSTPNGLPRPFIEQARCQR